MTNILIADDEFGSAGDVRRAVEKAGFCVCEIPGRPPDDWRALNGQEAARFAEELRPDLVLMDINMEGERDGIVAGRQVMERLGIPVIFVTAYMDSATVDAALESAPYGYIGKHELLQGGDGFKRTIRLALGLHESNRQKANLASRITKLEMAQELAKVVAHDLNNVLMRANASMGATRTALNEVKSMAGNLMSFAEDIKPLELVSLLTVFRSQIHYMLPESVQLHWGLSVKKAWVLGCELSLKRLLTNLAQNSLRHGVPHGGTITVRLTKQVGDSAVDDLVLLSVSDDGAGMSEATKRKLLAGEQHTTHAAGHGLGFRSVQNIVESHGAQLDIDSRPGNGTNMTISFPSIAAPATELPSEDHILLVEDEEVLALLFEAALHAEGYHVTCASSGAEALEFVEKVSDLALVFTDVNLPGLVDGRALARKLREKYPCLAIVLASGDATGCSDSGQLDGFPFLSKPYSPTQLLAKIRESLAKR